MARQGKIELYKAADGWRWRAKAGNGKIVGAAEEGIRQRAYAIKRACRQFPGLPVVEVS